MYLSSATSAASAAAANQSTNFATDEVKTGGQSESQKAIDGVAELTRNKLSAVSSFIFDINMMQAKELLSDADVREKTAIIFAKASDSGLLRRSEPKHDEVLGLLVKVEANPARYADYKCHLDGDYTEITLENFIDQTAKAVEPLSSNEDGSGNTFSFEEITLLIPTSPFRTNADKSNVQNQIGVKDTKTETAISENQDNTAGLNKSLTLDKFSVQLNETEAREYLMNSSIAGKTGLIYCDENDKVYFMVKLQDQGDFKKVGLDNADLEVTTLAEVIDIFKQDNFQFHTADNATFSIDEVTFMQPNIGDSDA